MLIISDMWIVYPKRKCGNCGKIEEKCGKNPHFLPLFLHSDVTDGGKERKVFPTTEISFRRGGPSLCAFTDFRMGYCYPSQYLLYGALDSSLTTAYTQINVAAEITGTESRTVSNNGFRYRYRIFSTIMCAK